MASVHLLLLQPDQREVHLTFADHLGDLAGGDDAKGGSQAGALVEGEVDPGADLGAPARQAS